MKFKTTPWRVINRNWKRYIADENWIIIWDENVKELFINLWFENLEKPVIKTKKK